MANVYWDLTPCSLVQIYRYPDFLGTQRLIGCYKGLFNDAVGVEDDYCRVWRN